MEKLSENKDFSPLFISFTFLHCFWENFSNQWFNNDKNWGQNLSQVLSESRQKFFNLFEGSMN